MSSGDFRGFIVQPTYRMRNEIPVIHLFGRLDDGRPFLVEDDRFRPYFFVRREDATLLADAKLAIEDSDLRDFNGGSLTRVGATRPAEVPALRERLARSGRPTFEADIRFPYRFLIDHGIRGDLEIRGEPKISATGLVRFHNPEIVGAVSRPDLRTLSIDLETLPDASRILSAALVGKGCEEVHLLARAPVEGAIVHADEAKLLGAVVARIRALDPDIITGWNVIDFDLRVFDARCEALGVARDLGRIPGTTSFQQDRGFTRQSRASIPGRMALDGIPLVRDARRLDDYRLETVAQAVLGRGKLLDSESGDAAQEILRLYREDPKALVDYNREDARLVLDILEREGLLDLAQERSRLSGMQLDRVGASVASFDLLYLPELRGRGIVAPSVDPERKSTPVKGGTLLHPVPGVFSQVALFDFKSLYPNLIRTFQLDPLAFATADDDAIEAPNAARFARSGAILPGIIDRFMERRDRAKRRQDRNADQAIKIMMNALFGVLGSPGCRFSMGEIANAITSFGQQTLTWTRDAFEEQGVSVLYGDTDSVFVQLRASGRAEALAEAEGLRERVETGIGRRIRDEYRVESRLELELEKVLDRFFLPTLRGGVGGSKKRYAGWQDGKLLVVGLESVRRDSPAIARRLQEGMLERLFTDRELLPFVRETVESVRRGELDTELIYIKRVRKGSLDRYTATTPPHVQAARKIEGRVGPVVRYVITRRGPEPVFPHGPIPEDVDREHYVDRILRPVAESILEPTGAFFADAVGEARQLELI